jgi:hypothetical protein|tara:strand:+ start:3179 stop:3910 length:732 start_codon:yes stop_codon:yes gene_type:complete
MTPRLKTLMALALLPFFEFFRGTPHQAAAVKELEDALPKELLAEDAAWFEAWKASGIAQKAVVPYVHQMEFKYKGYRRCLDASAAMLALMYGKVKSAEEYGEVRKRFGDTTDVRAQVRTLREIGLNAEFRNDADGALVEAEIASGRPVLVGWLHKGNLLRGHPPMCDSYSCGHWSVLVGFEGTESTGDAQWVMHDPMGAPRIERGGHETRYGGKNVKVPRGTFKQRWQVEGPGSGWVILVDDE